MTNCTCVVAGCGYNRRNVRRRNLDIIFHTFPADPLLRAKWIKFCRRKLEWAPKSNDAMCSVHFKEEDYQMTKSPLLRTANYLRRLNPLAVPTIRDGTGKPLQERLQIEEETREKLVQELYKKETENIDIDHLLERKQTVNRKVSVLPNVVYRLNKFPNICAFCFKTIVDEAMFVSFSTYNEELRCTIGEKFDEITGERLERTERIALTHLLPDKTCKECLEVMVQFHQYQTQLQCLRKFSTGLARMIRGSKKSLKTLYDEQGAYLARVLKNLNICPGPEEKVTLERLEAEVMSYGRIQKCTMFVPPPKPAPKVFKFHPVAVRQETVQISDKAEEPNVSVEIPVPEPQTVEKSPTNQHQSPPEHKDNKALQPIKKAIARSRKAEGAETVKKRLCPYVAICKELFTDEHSLQQHIASRHTFFKCNTCGLKFKFYELYSKHIESHAVARALLLSHNRKGANKELQCNYCGKVFQSEQLLQRHETTHSHDRNYVCDTCLGVFTDCVEFGRHKCSIAAVQVESSKDPFTDDLSGEPPAKKHDHKPEIDIDGSSKAVKIVTEVEYLDESLIEYDSETDDNEIED
uniref:THAP-type domain-containing protein n=1 Tax=Anopheles epiroticus TaxID=199890 RepID=A0A3F2YWL6_9DIPT